MSAVGRPQVAATATAMRAPLASTSGVSDLRNQFAKKAIEMDFVKKALSRNGGIVSRAARELGISRVNLYELIEKYNIRLQEFKMLRAGKNQIKTREVS